MWRVKKNEDQIAAFTLSRLGVVFNCSPAAGADWPLEDVSLELQKLLKLPAEATAAHASDFLNLCCSRDKAPHVAERLRRDHPVDFKAAYSWSLWLQIKAELNLGPVKRKRSAIYRRAASRGCLSALRRTSLIS